MSKLNKKIVDEILDRTDSVNNVHQRIPKVTVLFPFLLFAILYAIFMIAINIDSATGEVINFTSNIITMGVTVAIFYMTIHNEKRKEYKLARQNAHILSKILNSITKQLIQINDGKRVKIFYAEEWMEYYKQCSLYLKYDYFDVIVNEINIVNLINNAIEEGNEELLLELLDERRNNIMNSTADFDISAVCHNLKLFALEKTEDNSWKEQEQYKEFERFVLDNYTVQIKQLTETHLKELNGNCDVNSMQQYVLKELQKETALKSGKYKYIAMENKAILKPIFKVYRCLTEDDSFGLCWGVLTLKKNNK